jgi:hypothetical protein
MGTAMAHEKQRELQALSDAEAYPRLRRYYSFKNEAELAATARRLGREPAPHIVEISERPMPDGPTVYLIRIYESGRMRLRELRVKLAADQR